MADVIRWVTRIVEQLPQAADRNRVYHLLYGRLVVLGMGLLLCIFAEELSGAENEPAIPIVQKGMFDVGKPAPNFIAADIDGKPITLQDYQEHPVVINFWAMWCEPCKAEMQAFQVMHEAHRQAGLVILAVHVNPNDEVKSDEVRLYLSAAHLTFTTLVDVRGSIATQYNVFLLPHTVFISPSGEIMATHRGPMTQVQIDRYVVGIMSQ